MNLKNILLVVAIIVIVAGTVMFLMAHQAHPKHDSKIMMTSADNLTEGDNITLKLTDVNNTPISNQNVAVSIVNSSGKSLQKSLTTGVNGEVTFKTDNLTTGSCAIVVKYNGNDKFDGCNFTENVNINKKKVIPIKTNSTQILGNNTKINKSSNVSTYYDTDIVTVEDI